MKNSNAHSAGSHTTSSVILIVDDDAMNRKVLGDIFSEFYTVEEAQNGREGIERIQKDSSRLCAIFLDVLMPEMNGIEVLHWLKDKRLLEKIPTFLIASEAGEDVMREAYELGVMDVIDQPVISYVALRRVQSVIEQFEARKRLNAMMEASHMGLTEQTKRIIQLNQGMIVALATAIEFRNQESSGHVQRICEITRLMLQHTDFGKGLDTDEIENIALASIMHDIGKIAVPDAVLSKPGKLTAKEYGIIKSHTTQGADILESIPQLKDSGTYGYAYDIVRHHHERWDGQGYPDGLKGDEITPWAQVVSLADVYDALSCKRVYKPSFPREQVVGMIRTGECGLFNPHLVESFLMVEDRLYELYADIPETQDE